MQCARCQHENPAGQKFCGECGARLEARCPACNTTNLPGQKFCGECGARLPGTAQPAPPATPSPESYTPKHLAERILTSRGALEGERKQVTVLFADLKGSMELLAERDPEEARRILDPVLERMMEAVHRYEGTVNQVMGDGIMALFGAPLAHEDHAVRACYAALRMQESARQYAEVIRSTVGLPIQIRVGLNSGEVVVRSIGSDLRMDYTAVGQTTHLAARMEQLATPGSVLLAPDTMGLAEGYVQVKPLGPTAVKGLNEPIEVYELVGPGQARSRLQAAAARGLTKFVGRDSELETLRRTLEQVVAGHGQLVALVGEPGVGKSRVVWEFSHSHRARGWLVLESSSVSYGKATPYLPVIDLLKAYCGIEARDDQRRVREKILGKLLTLDRVLEPALPALLSLLDVPVEDPAWEALDPSQRRQRILDAVKRLLLRESQEQPLLLVFEDLHWIDSETQALLDSLVESLPAARILLLVNYRPEYEHGWHRKTYYQQLRLSPLAAASAEELLDALVGDETSLDSVKQLLIERTEGNPFFLEESVRSLVESGVLAGERGSYRLARPIESTQVPATVQAVLAARIDRLAPEDKRLLQTAAVIGKDVPYPLLQAIAELPDDALRQGLARLHAAELLYETRLFPDLEYTFKHALTHEVAYSSLLQERRRGLHARIVGALEALYPDRLAEQAEGLAHHALRAEMWEKAVAYCRQAGQKAAMRSAHREAVAYCEQALAALGRLPERRDRAEQGIDLRLALWRSLVSLGELQRLVGYLREAETLAAAIDDPYRLALVSAYMSNHLWQAGDHQSALAYGERAVALATAAGDLALQLQARVYLSMPCYTLGDYDRAIALLRQNVGALEGSLLPERFGLHYIPAVNSRSWLVSCLVERGEFVEALARAEEALQIAQAVDNPFSSILAAAAVGQCHLSQGDLLQAIAPLERALAICQERDIPLLVSYAAPWLGYAYALSGRAAEAIALLEELVSGMLFAFRARWLAWLGEAHLLIGQRERASECAAQALAVSRQQNERGNQVYASRLLGEIAAYADPPDIEQAETHYHQALALAEELGMRPLAGHCHLGLGTLYQRAGRRGQAQSELATACEMYRAIEMAYWLERAQAVGAGAAGDSR
jgi:class 3 adenylate cyclase/tetratricopeptide (TPR) repeat protein